MYVARVPNRGSPPAILLRQSYREGGKVKNRTLANLSRWPEDKVDALSRVLKGLPPRLDLAEAFEITGSLPHGHVVAVAGTAAKLGVTELIDPAPCRNRDLVCAWIRRTCGHINTPRVRGPTRLPQGALSNYKKAADEPDDHAIGRSRGGLTTKIHALTDQREAPVAVRLTAGQAGDNPQLVPLLDDYGGASKDRGVSGRDFRLLADKAYSHPSMRTELRSRRIKHTIPERKDQIARRKAKGSAGGRPPAFDAALYGLRNTVERGFNRLKQWRGVATRYDKYALTYLGGVLLACAVIHARVGANELGDTP